MMHVNARLTALPLGITGLALTAITNKDFLADVPPGSLLVRVSVSSDLLHTIEKGARCRSAKHKIVQLWIYRRLPECLRYQGLFCACFLGRTVSVASVGLRS